MTVEAQKSADHQIVLTGENPAASMVEHPSVTIKKLIADKAKNHHGAKTDLSFDTDKIFSGNAAVKAVPSISRISQEKQTRELEMLQKYFQTGEISTPAFYATPAPDWQIAPQQDLRLRSKELLQNSVQPNRSKSPEQGKSKDAAPSSKPTDAASPTQAKETKSATDAKSPTNTKPATDAKAATDEGTETTDSKGTKTTTFKDGAVRVERKDGSGYTLTPQPDGSFIEHKWARAPEHVWTHDDNKDPDRVLTPDQAMKERHDQLVADAKANIHNPKELAKFQDDLTKLEQRAKKDNVSPTQLAKMYASVDTLITSTATTPSDQSQRRQLAEQIISQAADPMRIHQGSHNTCGAADLEVATYLKHPEAAARMVSDVALTGQYTAMDGSTVQVDPQAHNESKLPDNGYNRSHASEIFQVGALNIALKQDAKLEPDYIKDGKYWQSEDGEHVQVVRGDKTITDTLYPLNDFEIPLAYSAITGDKSLGTISQDDDFAKKATSDIVDVTRFKTEKDFDDYMAHAKMPVVVLINSDNGPFDEPAKLGSGEKYADRDNSGHYILVTGYEAGPPPKATIYNTQGQDFAFGKGGQISVHDLYQAMLNRRDTIKELQKDIADDKKQGRVDNEKELELLRLEIESGTVSKKQAEREAKLILSHMSAAEKKNDVQTITNIYGALGISMGGEVPETTN